MPWQPTRSWQAPISLRMWVCLCDGESLSFETAMACYAVPSGILSAVSMSAGHTSFSSLSSDCFSFMPSRFVCFMHTHHETTPASVLPTCDGAVQISEGHRRNAITYTSLICAAEKAGQWALALELFHRVAADGVGPNAAIFNAAMSACAQGDGPALKSSVDSCC